ncbi:CAP domain-containing protein [Streptomyces litchfieldiae]|uniref:CAP domain-containing protein n=1 Tax=Streptomyces litchfieldiae TaxID=3075543 RepID=A0ABU2MI53_9ACTN|nr:CAP domain-containing protein [Streptomyces sp. DSM 44938]MDT0341161.1 CAP domain-containing protein [Streptomyces sp. DSM 44938]
MGRHRRRRGHARTGLIGASAALAVGAVAVGAGLLPGIGDGLMFSDSEDVGAQDGRVASESAAPTSAPDRERDRDREKPDPETSEPAEETTEPAPPTEEPSPSPSTEAPEETEPAAPSPEPEPSTEEPPPDPAPEEPEPAADPETAEAEAVLALVNEERTRAGCRPVTLDPALTSLANAFSRDMAERGFFDHTDPDGRDPWDRAEAAGITYLGGENIALGQQDAQAVMDAWMNSEGHRANILNCEFTTLGIGVHIADGGPWWTQDFGF